MVNGFVGFGVKSEMGDGWMEWSGVDTPETVMTTKKTCGAKKVSSSWAIVIWENTAAQYEIVLLNPSHLYL